MPNPMDLQAGINWDTGTWDDPFTPENETSGDPVVYWTEDERKRREGEQSLVKEQTGNAVEDWAKQNGYKISDETLDYLYNQFFTEKNNESAWQRTMSADSTKYQRAVEDMKKAGLNPFLLMSNGASGAGTSSPGSVGYGSASSRKNAQTQAAAQGIGSALGVLGAIIGAMIIAMA